MKLAGIYNHVRLDSGLVRRRGGGTSALSKRTTTEGAFLRRTPRAQSDFSLRRFAISLAFFAFIFLPVGNIASTLAQEPSPAPSPQELQVPAIAPEFHPAQKPLPELSRVGVDMDRQKPLTIREALALALENNKDIEVARQNVKIAEFDLTAARGAYDPRLSSSTYYERINNPISSFLAGGSNGTTTSSDYTGTARLEGQAPMFGGNYRLDFSSIRQTTNNQFVPLSPQYPTALTFNFTQPLLRGLRLDNSRRQIEIAKKNLSLTDAQFRQRAIETITSVQRAYWDLVFSLRNLQVQRDAVRDSQLQLEHNKRLVSEGALAPIDVVAAEAQVAGFEQSLFSSLEEVSRAENNLKNLIAVNREADLWNLSIVPTDSVDLAPPVISLPEALKAAMDNRPELQQSNVVREINQIDQKYFREQTKPAIDLVGSYGMVGLAGLQSRAGNPFISVSNQELRDRVDQLLDRAGLPLLMPQPPQAIAFSDWRLRPVAAKPFGQSLQQFSRWRTNQFAVAEPDRRSAVRPFTG
jgi:HAE1 family hydrophobic/amphiphilic exporter-1